MEWSRVEWSRVEWSRVEWREGMQRGQRGQRWEKKKKGKKKKGNKVMLFHKSSLAVVHGGLLPWLFSTICMYFTLTVYNISIKTFL